MDESATVNRVSAYAGVLHWLKAVRAAGTLDADAVAAKRHPVPAAEAYHQAASVRSDGSLLMPMRVWPVQTRLDRRGSATSTSRAARSKGPRRSSRWPRPAARSAGRESRRL